MTTLIKKNTYKETVENKEGVLRGFRDAHGVIIPWGGGGVEVIFPTKDGIIEWRGVVIHDLFFYGGVT